MNKNFLIDGIKQAGERSAWVQVFSPDDPDRAAIIRDEELLNLLWKPADVKLMQKYFNGGRDIGLCEAAHEAMDRGLIPFSDLVDMFFQAKSAALKKLEETVDE